MRMGAVMMNIGHCPPFVVLYIFMNEIFFSDSQKYILVIKTFILNPKMKSPRKSFSFTDSENPVDKYFVFG